MKALDGFLDRRANDGGFDLLTSRVLSRESNFELDLRYRITDSRKPGVAVASNYFALACPILPIGLLAAFMFLDKLDSLYEGNRFAHEDLESRRRADLTRAMYVSAMREKLEIEKKKKGLGDPPPLQSEPPKAGAEVKAARKRKEQQTMVSSKSDEGFKGQMFFGRGNQGEVGRAVKQKMRLEEHLEKVNKEQDYSAVCRLSSRIELLDKALKRMGC